MLKRQICVTRPQCVKVSDSSASSLFSLLFPTSFRVILFFFRISGDRVNVRLGHLLSVTRHGCHFLFNMLFSILSRTGFLIPIFSPVTSLPIYYLLNFLTHLLTPCSKVLLKKLTGFQLVKKLPAVYGTRRFITAFTGARQLSL